MTDRKKALEVIFRSRSIAYGVMFSGPVLAVLLYLTIPERWWHTPFLLCWVISAAVAFLYAYQRTCPACRRRFHGGNVWTSFFAKHCRHCGFGLDSDDHANVGLENLPE